MHLNRKMHPTKSYVVDTESENCQYLNMNRNIRLTGVEPSSETLALEKDKLPAKNEPPLWNTLRGLCASAGHLCTEESVVETHIPSPCSSNFNIGCSFEHSNTLSLVAKSVKYNYRKR